LRLLTLPELETYFLAKDELMAIIPVGHRYADNDSFPVETLRTESFMLLEKDAKSRNFCNF
jgi:hypothetical protein